MGTSILIGTTAISMFLGVGAGWLVLRLLPKKGDSSKSSENLPKN